MTHKDKRGKLSMDVMRVILHELSERKDSDKVMGAIYTNFRNNQFQIDKSIAKKISAHDPQEILIQDQRLTPGAADVIQNIDKAQGKEFENLFGLGALQTQEDEYGLYQPIPRPS